MNEQELLPQVTKKLEQLEALTEFSKSLVSSLELKNVLAQMLDKISLMLCPSNWSLLLADQDQQSLSFEIVVGPGSDKLKGQRLAWGEGIAGWVAKEQKPLVISDVSIDDRFSSRFDKITSFETNSVLAVPMVYRTKCFGVIELVSKKEEQMYTEEHLHILKPFADFAAIAISNALHYSQIQRLTLADDATRLYNARHMHIVLENEVKRSLRYHHPVGLIFFDMDHFKSINDTHGHLIGTRLLSEIGDILLDTVRETDVPIRYGGDEFVIILPETSRDGVKEVAVRIWQLIREKHFLMNMQQSIHMTASVGCACFPDDATDDQGLLTAADDAMYLVKNKCRDHIAFAQQGLLELEK